MPRFLTYLTGFFRSAFQGIRSSPLLHMAACLVMALAVFFSGMSFSVTRYLDNFFGNWGSQAQVTVFLRKGVTAESAQIFLQRVNALDMGDASLVSPEEALERLKAELKEDHDVLESLPVNPLLWSVEVRPRERFQSPQALTPVVEALRAESEVERVEDGMDWFNRFSHLAQTAHYLGFLLLVFSFAAATAVTALTLRLTIYARQNEIDLFKMVGATWLFINAPFLIEGTVLGILAALPAFGGFLAVDALILPEIQSRLAFLIGSGGLPPIGTLNALSMLATEGAVLGFLGSALSLRR